MGCIGECKNGCCGSCQRDIELSPTEVELLMRLAEIPFLPVARRLDDEIPVYLEDSSQKPETYSIALMNLWHKRLVSLDYDQPLINFGYQLYQAYPVHGSMALTALGQRVVDILELQGIQMM